MKRRGRKNEIVRQAEKRSGVAVELRAIRRLLEMDLVNDEPDELAEDLLPAIVAGATRRVMTTRPAAAPVHLLPPWGPAPPSPPLLRMARLLEDDEPLFGRGR